MISNVGGERDNPFNSPTLNALKVRPIRIERISLAESIAYLYWPIDRTEELKRNIIHGVYDAPGRERLIWIGMCCKPTPRITFYTVH